MFSLPKTLVSITLNSKYSYIRTCSMNVIINELKSIFLKSVAAVEPRTLIKNNVTVKNNKLLVCDKEYNINRNCYVIGFGKAVLGMASEMESLLGCHLVTGIVSVPTGIFSSRSNHQNTSSCGEFHIYESAREIFESKIKYFEGAVNNLPDAAAERTAKAIFELAGNLNEIDLLIVMISGGGSALLPFPVPPVTLQEKTDLIKLLSRQGADILELNCVRKRLSQLKGGGLACQAYPTPILALVLSDIIEDPLDCIASGPTTPTNDAPDAAALIIKKYDLRRQLPNSIHTVLSSRIEPDRKVPKTSDGSFIHVTNFVIGNNSRATSAAATEAKRLGYQTYIISDAVNGDVREISAMYARLATETAKLMKGISSVQLVRKCLLEYKHVLKISDDGINEIFRSGDKLRAMCFIAGGEPTVVVRGRGKGGRNQQLALQFAIDVNNALQPEDECVKRMNISLLSCGTDGIDGPTDAAGAIGSNYSCDLAQQQNINPIPYLQKNDCYNFYKRFQNGQYLIQTGHTGTNVMDIHILVINDKN